MFDGLQNLAYSAVSMMWLELLMFALAVVVYVLFTGGFVQPAPAKEAPAKAPAPKAASPKAVPARPSAKSARPAPAEESWRSEKEAKEDVQPGDVAKHVAMIRARGGLL